MLSTVQIVTQPAIEPVSIDLVRRHCRIDQSSDDDLLAIYLTSARIMAEMYLGRALITQTLLWTVTPEDRIYPQRHKLKGPLEIPRAPVQSIDSVTVLDARGNSTTIEPATLPVPLNAEMLGYRTDLAQTPPRLVIGLNTVMSDGRLLRFVELENIQIQMIAGYGNAGSAVPQQVINAILLTTSFLYENRGDVEASMPRAAEWLLDTVPRTYLG